MKTRRFKFSFSKWCLSFYADQFHSSEFVSKSIRRRKMNKRRWNRLHRRRRHAVALFFLPPNFSTPNKKKKKKPTLTFIFLTKIIPRSARSFLGIRSGQAKKSNEIKKKKNQMIVCWIFNNSSTYTFR